MATANVAELIARAGAATDPFLVSGKAPAPGGVDPLGLRQINFNLMDQVFPGVNNVARHIRPFVVVTWAWRRAAQLAGRAGMVTVPTPVLRDFVDRIEVIYAWSQFMRPESADLPGRDVLADLMRQGVYRFGGKDWERRRETRRDSTGFSAAINYGPGLRSLGWLQPAEDGSGAFQACPAAAGAIDAFEEGLAPHLDHPAFSQLGEVEVAEAEVRLWSTAWDLQAPSAAEKAMMARVLCGDGADKGRAAGVTLAVQAAMALSQTDPIAVRRAMSGRPSNFDPPASIAQPLETWRKVQVRQVFRLALEGLFAWTIDRLGVTPLPTEALVNALLMGLAVEPAMATRAWLAEAETSDQGPVERLEDLAAALASPNRAEVPVAFWRALAFCLKEAPAEKERFEHPDRLPLAFAAEQVRGWLDQPLGRFLAHVIEAWLFGQHTYWAVGRGLADARANGRQLLRLRVVMEEGGWSLTKGASAPSPVATADRLGTILSLAREAELLGSGES